MTDKERQKMKILIIGGTGVISRAIVNEGLKRGHEMVLFNRGSRKVGFEDQVEIIHGDRKNPGELAEKMQGRTFDVVIDMIAFNPEDAKLTIEVFADKAKQIIVTSSMAVYKRPLHSLPTTEDAEELIQDMAYPYGYKKARMEEYLEEVMKEGIVPVTIIRPSLTFGEGCANIGVLRQNQNIPDRIRKGKALLLPGDGVSPWSFTFAPDMGRAYIAACLNPNTMNQTFHVMNTEFVLWEDLYRVVGELLGIEPKFAYLPTKALVQADPSLFGHFEFEKKYANLYSVDKFQKAVPEWKAEISLKEGMKMMLDWWEKEQLQADPEKDALEDQLCAVYNKLCADLKETLAR